MPTDDRFIVVFSGQLRLLREPQVTAATDLYYKPPYQKPNTMQTR